MVGRLNCTSISRPTNCSFMMIPVLFLMDEVVMDQPIPFTKLRKEAVGHSIPQTKHSHSLLSQLNHGFKLNELGIALSLYV